MIDQKSVAPKDPRATILAELEGHFKGVYGTRDRDLLRYVFELKADDDIITIAYRVRRSRKLVVLEVWFKNIESILADEVATEETVAQRYDLFNTESQPVLAAAQSVIATLRYVLDAMIVTEAKDAAYLELEVSDLPTQRSFMNELFKATVQSGVAVYRDVYSVVVGVDDTDRFLVMRRVNEVTRTHSLEVTNAAISTMYTQWRRPNILNASEPSYATPFELLRRLEKQIFPKGGVLA